MAAVSLPSSLDTGYSVKVSDGALSQLFFPDCYCNVKGSVRPARWAAIETLRQGHLTSLSNVVSGTATSALTALLLLVCLLVLMFILSIATCSLTVRLLCHS